MRYFIPIFIILIVTAISILGYRGNHSKNTPIEVFPDMDRQAKYKPQTINERFADKQADRLPVPNTRVRGNLLDLGNVFSSSPDLMTAEVRTGKTSTGEWVAKIPTDAGIDMSLMRLGKERYDIHCAICHGEYGNGRGVTAQFGLVPRNLTNPSLTATYLKVPTDGEIYHAITNGSASQIMLGLKDKLSPRERWAIVLYVRTLQSYVAEAMASKKGKDS
jgi:mono/diheme cytochrome c family protein